MKGICGWSVRNKLDRGKVFNRNGYAKVRDEKEWIVKKGTDKIPQIISEEDFFKVKELWKNNINYKINKGKYNGISEFASKIYCGKCGGVYHKNVDKGRHYYNCSSKRKYGTNKCNNKNIYVTQINERITPEKYRNDLYSTNIYYGQELITLSVKLMHNLSIDDKEKVQELNIELDTIKERKNRVLNMYEMQYINENEFKQKIEPINKKVESLEKEINEYSKSNNEIMKDLQDIQETMQKLQQDHFVLTNQSDKKFEKEHTREKIINDIKTMIVNEDGTIDIHYKTFDRYYELREKHRELLNIYVKEGDVEKLVKEITNKLNDYKKDIYTNNDIKKRV